MRIWHEYYQRFREVDPANVREGCEPRVFEHEERARRSIVLLHGLTDSPHFMRAIGRRFAERGFDVYLPLLHMHGLREPRGMAGVSLEAWKENVAFAVDRARARSDSVSIGGLSMGGALAAWEVLRPDSRIDGGAYLFGAAFALHDRIGPIPRAPLRRWLRGTPLARLVAGRVRAQGPMIGENPYRYARMETAGVIELLRLMREIEALRQPPAASPFPRPLFVAHSAFDRSADIRGVERLLSTCSRERSSFFRIGRGQRVSHAEVVLEEDVTAAGRVLERRNPRFDAMMEAALSFAERSGESS